MEETIKSWLFDPAVGKFITALIVLIALFGISRLAKRSVTRYVRTSDTRYKLRKFITFLTYLAAILILSIVFSDRLGGLTVALGVAGAGIAFALQEVISSFAGWFAISFAHFYSPGDRVEVGGIKGDVIDISFLRTTIMECGEWVDGDLYNGRVVRVANSFVFKAPVYNYSGEFPFLWDEIKVPVKYGSEEKYTRQTLQMVADELVGDYAAGAKAAWVKFSKQFLLEDAAVEPMVTLVATDNWLEYTVRYVTDYKLRRRTKDLLFTRIVEEFARSEGKAAFASATFHIVETPPLDINIRNG
ncbi:MAG: mechanosensitive ion channel family protein [Acidobacteria bacterium]|nr:mechanosensitive ion channel family protein [Acidobacteriota bacterium]